jgi:hypothetical protein
MKYQDILNVLKTAGNECLASLYEGKGLFHYGIKEHHQEQRSEAMPQIQVDPFNDILDTEKSTKSIQIFIGFLDQDTNNSTEQEQKDIHFRMEYLSKNFFALLSEEEEFSEIIVSRDFIYRFSDACLTGVVCSFNLKVPVDLCFDLMNPALVNEGEVYIKDGSGNLIATVPVGKTFVIDSSFTFGYKII